MLVHLPQGNSRVSVRLNTRPLQDLHWRQPQHAQVRSASMSTAAACSTDGLNEIAARRQLKAAPRKNAAAHRSN